MKPQLALFGAVAAMAATGAYVFLTGASSDPAATPSAVSADGMIVSPTETPTSADETLAGLGQPAATERLATEAEVQPAALSSAAGDVAASALRNVDAASAQSVTVEIAWPSGVPAAGEEAFRVIAWSDPEVAPEDFDWTSDAFRRSRQRRSSGAAAIEAIEKRADDDEVRFDIVELDGREPRVEVLFDADARTGRVQLAGPFLYLTEVPEIDLAAGERAALLEPQLGAWITGKVDVGTAQVSADGNGSYGSVTLRGGTMGRGRGRRMNFVDQTVALGADMSFDFYGVNPTLVLQVSADVLGLAPMTSEPLDLAPGEKTTCAMALRPGGGIQGRVLDLAGKPVAGATVQAAMNSGMWGRRGPVREAESDREGRFSIGGLEAGSYRPTAELEGWRAGKSEEAIDIAEDAVLSDVVVRIDQGREITGRVVLPNGSPAPDATVKLSQPKPKSEQSTGMGWGRPRNNSESKETMTNARGEFRLTALANTPARISVGLDPDPAAGREGFAAAIEDVQPALPGKGKAVVIRLAPTVGIRGRVTDDRGTPVTEFRVSAAREGFSSRDGAGDGVRERFEGREDGTFELSGASPGGWRVSISAEGLESPEDQTLFVQLPQEGEALEFQLIRQGTIRGVVVDPRGTPVPGATVRRASTGGFGGWRRDVGVTAADDGTFEIRELSAGNQVLVAGSDDWAPSEETTIEVLPGMDSEGAVLTLREGGTITGVVRDDDGNPWAGRRVTYATGGGPIAMFGGESTTDTDSAGRFRFEHVAPGDWVVNASPGEREMMEMMQGGNRETAFFDLMSKNLTADVTVVDGEEVSVELGAEARDPVTVVGSVTRGGDAVGTGSVTFVAEGAEFFSNLKRESVERDGSYRIELDRPGAYIVTVERNDIRNQFLVDVVSGAEQRVDLALPDGGISGRVRDSNGDPAVGVRVTVEPQSSINFSSWNPRAAITDESGGYEILELDPGTYAVRFGARGFGPGARGASSAAGFGRALVNDVEVTRTEVTSNVNVEISGAGRITGVVVDVSGEPVPGATIFVRDRNGRSIDSISTTRTGSSGRFTYDRISPGTYTVSARTDRAVAPDVSGVIVKEGEDADVELELGDGSTLVITTVDDEGEPVRADLSVTDSEGREMTGLLSANFFRRFGANISTSEQRVGPVASGRYTIIATAEDGRKQRKRVTVRNKEETKVRVKFRD